MSDTSAQVSPAERPAISVPGFVVTWPKVVTLAGAILVSVGGGFWGLSNAVYEGLKQKVDRNETKNDALDSLTATIRESVAKQGAQLAALDRSVNQLTDQIKIVVANNNDTRDRIIAIDAKISVLGVVKSSGPSPEQR